MALNTAKKRQSASACSFYPSGPGVEPNASKDQAWRQAAGYGYSGNLVAGITITTGDIYTLDRHLVLPEN